MIKKLYYFRFCFFFIYVGLTNIGLAADRVTGETFALRSPVLAINAMAATSQPLATQVALEIMKGGGNAIDAAIAANALLSLNTSAYVNQEILISVDYQGWHNNLF